jgi:hypothetical protein
MKDYWGCLIPIVIVGVIVWFVFDIGDSKWWYATDFSLSADKIVIDKKPHDCEFLTAPLGSKHCHYDKVVQKIQWSMSTDGKTPLMSYDDWKTWQPFTPDPGETVPKVQTVKSAYISWKKIDD